jgi:hypothetical protein
MTGTLAPTMSRWSSANGATAHHLGEASSDGVLRGDADHWR